MRYWLLLFSTDFWIYKSFSHTLFGNTVLHWGQISHYFIFRIAAHQFVTILDIAEVCPALHIPSCEYNKHIFDKAPTECPLGYVCQTCKCAIRENKINFTFLCNITRYWSSQRFSVNPNLSCNKMLFHIIANSLSISHYINWIQLILAFASSVRSIIPYY